MPFQLSPGVNVTEIDLTGIVPAVATTTGAIAGIFNWGPVGERMLIDSETTLVNTFGKPNSNNAETWFTAANFLSYGNSLYVVRAANTTSADANAAYNAVGNTGSVPLNEVVVKNQIDFNNNVTANNTAFANVAYLAKYPGAVGNSIRVSVCDTVNAYSSNVTFSANLSFILGSNTATVVYSGAANATATTESTYIGIDDQVLVGNSTIGQQYMQLMSTNVASNATNTILTLQFGDSYRLHTNYAATQFVRHWEFFNVVNGAPQRTAYVDQNNANTAVVDGMHVVVVDEMGLFTGVPQTILESFQNVSRATDAKTVGGAVNYYKTVVNDTSKYVWAVTDLSGASSNTAAAVLSSTNYTPTTFNFYGGQDGFNESNAPLGTIASGYDFFASSEDVDIALVLQGKPIAGSTSSGGMVTQNYLLANYLIDNICEIRKDCVVFITPDDNIVVENQGAEATALVNWRNVVHDSSYAVMDSGYKYQYDRYNDVYRYIPTNGDIAGLCVRTDQTRDPWWSPAGFNRGQIKNLVKMRFNPRKADRDLLYSNGINPVVTFPGQGTVLFGDKTLQSKPSAFDRINVRRLFIVLEKAIATASKFFLFEFNDEFTRAQFKNLINPYLRDVQGRRGITDFLVVCDATNNTPERIDRNEFWGDIYIKPARSINFIQLNFIAVRTGVQFSEIVGQY
jgi:Phage tail sheath protein subtilisin-like domain/Phage tail sheath C-terminal domain